MCHAPGGVHFHSQQQQVEEEQGAIQTNTQSNEFQPADESHILFRVLTHAQLGVCLELKTDISKFKQVQYLKKKGKQEQIRRQYSRLRLIS